MSIEIGKKVSGKVTGITKFGAFVDLDEGKNGLVHISEISEGYVKDIHDVLEVGQVVDVLITNVADDGKIALSIRRLNTAGAETNRGSKPSHPQSSHQGSRPKYQDNSHPAPRSGSKPNFSKPSYSGSSSQSSSKTGDFDSMMSAFIKDSDDRLTSLKRNTEGKRGGRGGRRN